MIALELNPFVLLDEAVRRDLQAFQQRVWSLDVESSRSGRHLLDWFQSFWKVIAHHQRGQEEIVFPLLGRRARAFEPDLCVFRAEHNALADAAHHILDALAAYAGASRRVDRVVWRGALSVRVTRFAARLNAHLDREAADLLPLIRQHFTADEMRSIEQRVRRRTPLHIAGLLFPWILADAAPADEEKVLRRLPRAWRLLYRWRWKKSYERRVAPVFSTL
jgi:hemerythrin-like domain-containing protein